MCLAIPVRISELLDDERALASVGGIVREINIALVDGLAVGDYVILHVGYALSRLDESEAERTLALMSEGDVLASGSGESSGHEGRDSSGEVAP